MSENKVLYSCGMGMGGGGVVKRPQVRRGNTVGCHTGKQYIERAGKLHPESGRICSKYCGRPGIISSVLGIESCHALVTENVLLLCVRK
jgi:hypothetical protein